MIIAKQTALNASRTDVLGSLAPGKVSDKSCMTFKLCSSMQVLGYSRRYQGPAEIQGYDATAGQVCVDFIGHTAHYKSSIQK